MVFRGRHGHLQRIQAGIPALDQCNPHIQILSQVGLDPGLAQPEARHRRLAEQTHCDQHGRTANSCSGFAHGAETLIC